MKLIRMATRSINAWHADNEDSYALVLVVGISRLLAEIP